MPPYLHGVGSFQESVGAPPIPGIPTGVIGVPITAPKGPVNTCTLVIGSKAEAVKTFGSGVGNVDDVLSGIFDQGGATVVFVNVLDPTVHKTAVASKAYTFDVTTDTLEVDDNYAMSAIVKDNGDVASYVQGTDYNYDVDTGIFTRIVGGGIASGEEVHITYDKPDPSQIVDADVIGTVDGTGKHTGMQALLVAKSQVGVKPRIIGAPGLDTQAVSAAMVSILDELHAFGYISTDVAATKETAVTYRNLFGSKRLMPIFGDFLDSSSNTLKATARALGLRAKIDNTIGWHKTLSNVPVNNVLGIDKDISWDLTSANTVANFLNENEITTLINEKGFRFWGSRTCSADPDFVYESATRTSDIISDTIAEAQFNYIDKPMSKVIIDTIVERVNAKLRQWKSEGKIIDAIAWVDKDKNTSATLAAGQVNITYKFTPVPPLENLNFYQQITDEYYSQLVA